jgi:hypothetical protein
MCGGIIAGLTTAELVAAGIGAAGVVAAGAGAAVSAANASDAAAGQKRALQQTQKNADAAASAADQNFNKANQKTANTSAILSAAQQSGKMGASGTMLTGPQGVDPNQLSLGKSTLLGS